MRSLRRRLHFQLTPLLDLLLIVIFAQYMEVREETTARADQAATKSARLRELEADYDRLQQEHESATAQARHSRELRRELLVLRDHLDRALRRQREAGERFAEVFRMNEEAVLSVLDPQDPKVAGLSDEELERLRERFEEVASSRGRAALEHLLTYEEFRKRVDVWDLELDGNGVVTLTAGERTESFRAGEPGEFVDRAFAVYKSLPQPKSLVIILLTYEADVRVGPLRTVRNGLPPLVARMQEDAGGRTRFEWAELGFMADAFPTSN